jgi:hypothetical protein
MITNKQIFNTLEEQGLPLFSNSSKNYNLNLIGVRTIDNTSNKFNDLMVVMWFYGGEWNRLNFNITTDPGVYYRENPININGTAILKEGHHKGLWTIGKHKGVYEALTQTSKATVYRDNNKDDVLDFDCKTELGLFGINCHRSNKNATSTNVDKWSAGCQVFENPDDFALFMDMCNKAADNWGNKFSYTLLIEDWIK